jgi:hypothetical protein
MHIDDVFGQIQTQLSKTKTLRIAILPSTGQTGLTHYEIQMRFGARPVDSATVSKS